MGNTKTKFIGFDKIIKLEDNELLITVMGYNTTTFIPKTIIPSQEESVINKIINDKLQNNYTIYLYGKSSKDMELIGKKINQLKELGFYNFAVYAGGFFEYLLLRESFGSNDFPIVGNIESADVIDFGL
jgi:hypothetical protein